MQVSAFERYIPLSTLYYFQRIVDMGTELIAAMESSVLIVMTKEPELTVVKHAFIYKTTKTQV